MHHAYFVAGEREGAIAAALAYGKEALGLAPGSPDVLIERHGLFGVDDARRIIGKAGLAPINGENKLFILAVNRLFHEAQNAMLKVFEEPPVGTTLVLVLPGEGNLLYTLRSRLQPLPNIHGPGEVIEKSAQEFAKATPAAREKIVAHILDDAKSDDDEEKQEARAEALRFAEGLSRLGYAAWRKEKGPDQRDTIQSFLHDLDRLIPILHDRAAPLKPILEHILVIAPKKLA